MTLALPFTAQADVTIACERFDKCSISGAIDRG
jgi:hypothetical protein